MRGEGRPAIRWHNFPLPEVHLVALGIATVLHLIRHDDTGVPKRLRRLIGSTLVLIGGLWALWATSVASETDLEQPDRVIDTGPYARSRHPMYLAWTIIYLGISLLANLVWAWVLLPAVLVLTHREAMREEDRLRQSLPDQYPAYAWRVPRYL